MRVTLFWDEYPRFGNATLKDDSEEREDTPKNDHDVSELETSGVALCYSF